MSNKKEFLDAIDKDMQAVRFSLTNETLEDIPFQNAIIAECKFNNITFHRCDLSRLYDNQFDNCQFIDCIGYKGEIYRNDFVNCSFRNCNFKKAHFTNLGQGNQLNGTIENSIFINCDFTYGYIATAKFVNVTFRQCKIKENLEEKNMVVNINFIDCIEDEKE